MSITGVGPRSAQTVQSLVDMRQQLDDLQRQLGTGKKADTYAGVGINSGFAVGLRTQVSAFAAYDDTISNVNVRLSLGQTALGRISDIADSMKGAEFQSSSTGDSGSAISQVTASNNLDEILGLLNTQAGDRYLFSGRASDQPAVESLDHIMNGDGARAGLKQIIAERNQADLGATGLGRLVVSAPTATSVAVGEDAAGSPFGLKLAGINSTLDNAAVFGPTGVPPAISVGLTGLPSDGQTLQVRFTLPDGTSESINLTATTSATPGPNQFTIGASASATAANLQSALTASIGKLANTSLVAASAVKASDDFFGDPPQRVAGPPFNTATAAVAGTPANTVSWYTGEDGTDPARGTATARVDPSISVSYGARANEQGLRSIVQNVATLAAVSLAPNDPNAAAQSAALSQRIGTNLDAPAGSQTIADIEADFAGAQTTVAAATDRHTQTTATLSDMLDQIEGVPQEQVAAQILALQTQLQASLQTTALLLRTSLVNYL
jgi:flagellin-like hook-associated protein FlgL